MLGGGLGRGEIQMGREVITDVVLVPAEPRRVETRAPGVSSGREDGHQSARRQQRPTDGGHAGDSTRRVHGSRPRPSVQGTTSSTQTEAQERRGQGDRQVRRVRKTRSSDDLSRGQSRPRWAAEQGASEGEPRGGWGSLSLQGDKNDIACDSLYSFSAFKEPKGKIQMVGMIRRRTGYTGRTVENCRGRERGARWERSWVQQGNEPQGGDRIQASGRSISWTTQNDNQEQQRESSQLHKHDELVWDEFLLNQRLYAALICQMLFRVPTTVNSLSSTRQPEWACVLVPLYRREMLPCRWTPGSWLLDTVPCSETWWREHWRRVWDPTGTGGLVT